jgi:hypothetical protein
MYKFKNLSKQASFAVIGYIILLLSIFIPYNISNTPEKYEYNFKERFKYSLLLLLPIALSILTINCMVTGNSIKACGVLSWINSIIVFGWAFLIFLLTFTLVNNKKIPDYIEIDEKEIKNVNKVNNKTEQGTVLIDSELLN